MSILQLLAAPPRPFSAEFDCEILGRVVAICVLPLNPYSLREGRV